MTESNVEPQEAPEVEEAPEPELKEVDNNISPLRHTPNPCSTCG